MFGIPSQRPARPPSPNVARSMNALINQTLNGVKGPLFPNMHVQIPTRVAYIVGFKSIRHFIDQKIDPRQTPNPALTGRFTMKTWVRLGYGMAGEDCGLCVCWYMCVCVCVGGGVCVLGCIGGKGVCWGTREVCVLDVECGVVLCILRVGEC